MRRLLVLATGLSLLGVLLKSPNLELSNLSKDAKAQSSRPFFFQLYPGWNTLNWQEAYVPLTSENFPSQCSLTLATGGPFLTFPNNDRDFHFRLTNTDQISLKCRDRMVWTNEEVNPSIRAAILVDSRLYEKLKSDIDLYKSLAEGRRGFEIYLDTSEKYDDYHFSEVKTHLIGYRARFPNLEGVLFIGNIKLPSFYKIRSDLTETGLFPAYYENWNLHFTRHYKPGDIDPKCNGTNGPFCNVYGDFLAPEHDYDWISEDEEAIKTNEPDIWTAYLPVGLSDGDSYADFSAQLHQYFEKVFRFYQTEYRTSPRMYMVSNGLEEYNFWELYEDVSKVDFYAVNPDPKGTVPEGTATYNYCLRGGRTARDCYQRFPLESYSSYETFKNYYDSREWMGEGWQRSEILLEHLESNNYQFVVVNTHGGTEGSLLSNDQARTLRGGGLVMLAHGCSVGGYRQPNSNSFVSTYTFPVKNLLVSYLYGSSNFLAATGSPLDRGNMPYTHKLMSYLKQPNEYLGKAHQKRMAYKQENSDGEYRNILNEILLGDPFIDVE